MKEALASVVAGLQAEYADLRYEENRKTRVQFEGKELQQAGSYATHGGHVRAYANGGKAIASFSDPSRAAEIAASTAASAHLAGKGRETKIRPSPMRR